MIKSVSYDVGINTFLHERLTITHFITESHYATKPPIGQLRPKTKFLGGVPNIQGPPNIRRNLEAKQKRDTPE